MNRTTVMQSQMAGPATPAGGAVELHTLLKNGARA
jgi:hypothetical protein